MIYNYFFKLTPMSGLRYVYDPYGRNHNDCFVPLEKSSPTIAMDIPNYPVLGVIVCESLYLMHKGAADHCPLLWKKLEHNDRFLICLWNRSFECVVLTPPRPALFVHYFRELCGMDIFLDSPIKRIHFEELKSYMDATNHECIISRHLQPDPQRMSCSAQEHNPACDHYDSNTNSVGVLY